jgi:glutathione peroxidase
MKKIIVLTISIFMIFFKNIASANYDKLIYDFKINSITGEEINFNDYKNKAILLVNVASYCGFTKQYADLQKLWEVYRDKGFVVIGVPSNSFNQEKNSEKEIKKFCEVNFNINFPMTSIYEVKGDNAHAIYKWAMNNHGKSAIPKWNFHKILIGKDGKVADTFVSFTSPTSKKITKVIDKILN